MKKIIMKVFVLMVGLIGGTLFLIGGVYAIENDVRLLGYGFIMFSICIILITNNYLVIEDIRDLLDKMKSHEIDKTKV
jgi:hypothetical protein